jgi:hypothetical protein
VGSSGSDDATAVTTGLDGSIYVAGRTLSSTLDGQTVSSSADTFVSKFQPNGTKVWTKLIGEDHEDPWNALTTGLDGSIYVAGRVTKLNLNGQTNSGPGSADAYIVKLAPDGSTVWTRLLGSDGWDDAMALTTGLDGSIYVAGYSYSTTLDGQTNSGNDDAFITKFAPDGTKVWTQLVGSNGYDYGTALTTGLDGSIYLEGTTDSPTLDGQTKSGGSDVFICKFLPDGTKTWTKRIGSNGDDGSPIPGNALTTGLDGSIYAAGGTSSANFQGQGNAGNSDGFVVRLVENPTIAVSSNKSSLIVGQIATLTFNLSSPSTDFALGDITASGGTLSNFTGSGTSYAATFTPTANSTANGVVSFNAMERSRNAG